ncbi:hypothetical protein [Mycobacterium sp. DL440]|uniref:hypothetical protein n=1 Tax=Mycobacterium sp. DL440 TaxID=2675523 RepID=UPI00142218E6|nr:hypothetical protein [Mycobacterium sp. DL440]
MRIRLKYITQAVVAGAAAMAIGVAPAEMADPLPVQPAAVASAPAAANVIPAGFHGGGFHGGWGGGRGWHGGYGWGHDRQWWPWGW